MRFVSMIQRIEKIININCIVWPPELNMLGTIDMKIIRGIIPIMINNS